MGPKAGLQDPRVVGRRRGWLYFFFVALRAPATALSPAEVTRAALTPIIYSLAEKHPDLLPGLRFWAGLRHCQNQGLRVMNYRLPRALNTQMGILQRAADLLKSTGDNEPANLFDWVANVWTMSE